MTVVLFVIAGLIALVFVVGLLLPKQREYIRSAQFNSPVERVFDLVADVGTQATWRSDVKEIKVINQNTWTEVPKKSTPITFRTKQKIANQVFHIEIIEPKNFNGYWLGSFAPTSTGTKVVFKEVVTIGNPFARVMSLVFVDLDKTMDSYMADLKAKLGE